jgi:hypothetical protein
MPKYLKTALLLIGTNLFVLFFLATKAEAARFYFTPATNQFLQTCTSSVDIYVDTQGQQSNAADIEVNFNSNEVEIIDSNSSLPGKQIANGIAYESYFGNEVNDVLGRIRLAGGSFVSTLNGASKFATIQFRSKPGISSTTFTIRFDGSGNTLDSNVAQASTSLDLLTGVTNGSYTFALGDCIPDTTAPQISFTTPTNGQQNVAEQAPVTVRITDAQTGVDISTVEIIINNQVFTSSSAGVTVTGTPNNYVFTIDGNVHPIFAPNVASNIRVNATDFRSNFRTSNIQFNIPPPADTNKPYIEFVQPTDLISDYSTSLPLVLNIFDTESGVNIDAVEIYINGTLLFVRSSQEFSFTGNPNNYVVTLTNYLTLPQDKLTSFRVIAVDFAGNRREAVIGQNICLDSAVNPPPTTPTTTPGTTTNTICLGGEVPVPQEGIIRDFIDQAGPIGTVATISALAFILSLLPWLNLLSAPALLLNFLAVLFGKRANKSWGLVYDKISLRTIPLATIRAYSADTTNLVGQTVSDMNGRYRMLLPQGKYRIESMSPGYQRFVQDVQVDGDGRNLSLNIGMYTVRSRDEYRNNVIRQALNHFKDFVKQLNPILLFLGFILASIALFAQQSLANVVIFVLYLLIISLYAWNQFNQQRYGHVVDSISGYRVPAAVIKVYDSKSMEVVESLVTNALGQFDFFGEPGEYLLLVAAWGYNFPSVQQRDYAIEDRGVAKFLRVKLNSGRNRVRILLDPRSGEELVSQANPPGKFGMRQ